MTIYFKRNHRSCAQSNTSIHQKTPKITTKNYPRRYQLLKKIATELATFHRHWTREENFGKILLELVCTIRIKCSEDFGVIEITSTTTTNTSSILTSVATWCDLKMHSLIKQHFFKNMMIKTSITQNQEITEWMVQIE